MTDQLKRDEEMKSEMKGVRKANLRRGIGKCETHFGFGIFEIR